MSKNIFKLIILFIFGIAGGIFADQILWPYFIERPLFYQYRLEQAPINLTEINEIIVQNNLALQNSFEKAEKSVIGVKSVTQGGKIIQGSGIVVTSDGLIVTLAELIPQGGEFSFFVDGTAPNYQILKRDLKTNLALIKIEETNLPTIDFAEFGGLKLGQGVFLIGTVLENNDLKRIVNAGIIKTYNEKAIETNILESNSFKGSPLFNFNGELVGINNIDSENRVLAVPINKIREFIGF